MSALSIVLAYFNERTAIQRRKKTEKQSARVPRALTVMQVSRDMEEKIAFPLAQ